MELTLNRQRDLTEELLSHLDRLSVADTVYVAYSGGVDSHLLLVLLAELQTQHHIHLKAIHVHHGLLPEADAWTTHCQQVCDNLHVPLIVKRVKIDVNSGESVEALARDARYAVFQKIIQPGDLLCLAHHQDDQAETVLLQLFRGAGVQGLSAMPEVMRFGYGVIIRPFLSCSRDDIMATAESRELTWINDTSNSDVRFDRNYLRQVVMPLLKERWPSIGKTISRSAQHLATAATLLRVLAKRDFKKVKQQHKNQLLISGLKTLPRDRIDNVLRYWIQRNGFLMPQEKHLDQIVNSLLTASLDREPSVRWSEAEVRRFGEVLYIMKPLPVVKSVDLEWDYQSPLKLPADLGTLHAVVDQGYGLKKSALPSTLHVRFRQGGEKIQLPKREGRASLKTLFQAWRVPPWERDRIPLIYAGDELIAVLGYAIAEGYLAENNDRSINISHRF